MSIGCMYAWHYKGLAFVAIGVILAVLNPHDVLRILAPTLFIGALVLVWDLRRPWSPPSLE